jgi:hypothetical protein
VSRLRTHDELKPIPEGLQPLIDRGEIKDIRKDIPVHTYYGTRIPVGLPGEGKKSVNRQRTWKDIIGICIHHTGSVNDDPIKTAEYHVSPGEHITKDSRGLPTIAYPIVITKHDALLVGDILDVTYAQGPGSNQCLIAIAVMGNFDAEHDPTPKQMDNLHVIINRLMSAFETPNKIWSYGNVLTHADLGKPSCPGPSITHQIRRARENSKEKGYFKMDINEAVKIITDLGITSTIEDSGMRRRAIYSEYQRRMGIPRTGTLDPLTELLLWRGSCNL